MMQEHKGCSEATDALHVTISAVAEERGLIHRFGQWMTFHQKQLLLWKAKQEAESAAASLSARHDAVEAQVDARKKSSSSSGGQTSPTQQSVSGRGQAAPSHEDSAAMLKAAKLRAADQKALASFDKQIDDQKQLAENYGNWIEAVAAKQRTVLHNALNGISFILGILLIGVFFDSSLKRLLAKTSLDHPHFTTRPTLPPP